jgi:hypothetical protein
MVLLLEQCPQRILGKAEQQSECLGANYDCTLADGHRLTGGPALEGQNPAAQHCLGRKHFEHLIIHHCLKLKDFSLGWAFILVHLLLIFYYGLRSYIEYSWFYPKLRDPSTSLAQLTEWGK